MLKSGQFSIAALLIATALVALACGAVQFIRTTREPERQFEAALLVPVLLCGAVGVLRGRVRRWVSYGVMFDIGLMLLALVWVGFRL